MQLVIVVVNHISFGNVHFCLLAAPAAGKQPYV